MLHSFEAIVDKNGHVHLLEDIKLSSKKKAIVTIFENDISKIPETALLSEQSLAKDWGRPEEEKAWAYLQADQLS